MEFGVSVALALENQLNLPVVLCLTLPSTFKEGFKAIAKLSVSTILKAKRKDMRIILTIDLSEDFIRKLYIGI